MNTNDHGKHRSVLDRTDDDSFYHGTPQQECDPDREEERGPVAQAGVDQAPGDVGGEHRHLALREVHEVRRLVDSSPSASARLA